MRTHSPAYKASDVPLGNGASGGGPPSIRICRRVKSPLLPNVLQRSPEPSRRGTQDPPAPPYLKRQVAPCPEGPKIRPILARMPVVAGWPRPCTTIGGGRQTAARVSTHDRHQARSHLTLGRHDSDGGTSRSRLQRARQCRNRGWRCGRSDKRLPPQTPGPVSRTGRRLSMRIGTDRAACRAHRREI